MHQRVKFFLVGLCLGLVGCSDGDSPDTVPADADAVASDIGSADAGSDSSDDARVDGSPGDVQDAASDTRGDGALDSVVDTDGAADALNPEDADGGSDGGGGPDDTVAPQEFADRVARVYSGDDAAQLDVSPGAIDAERVAVARGVVRARGGAPLPGVRVVWAGEPALGFTTTAADGSWMLARNGGGTNRVHFEADGFIRAQREVVTRWNEFTVIDDVTLVPFDEVVTTVSAEAASWQVVRSSVATDSEGARRTTLLVPPGTAVSHTLEDGTSVDLEQVSVRATEFTVGDDGPSAMPASLPAASAYTWAAELSTDEGLAAGAVRVSFDQALPMYVENFLEFPVGTDVPLGYYDDRRGAWVPAPDGRIVEIAGVADDGGAELIVDVSGAVADAAALASLGITDEERVALVGLFDVGTSVWRVEIDHFTPWDCNWPYGPPEGAEPPLGTGPAPGSNPDDPDEGCGSIIECQSQVLGESIDIPGTGESLHYRSSRVPGRDAGRVVDIPVTGETLPEPLIGIEVSVSVAGRRFVYNVPLETDYVLEFSDWDGTDVFGNPLNGDQLALVTVDYLYPLQYYAPADFAASFGVSGTAEVIGERGGSLVRLRNTWAIRLQGIRDARRWFDLGGWSFGPHHWLDTASGTLFHGDGTIRRLQTLDRSLVTRVAGNGYRWSRSDDPADALNRGFGIPSGIAVAPDGTIYINFDDRLRSLSPDGELTVVAGATAVGSFGLRRGDAIGLALDARFNQSRGIDVGPDGRVYIADLFNNRIKRFDPSTGTVDVYAGLGEAARGNEGDGGPAVDATLDYPSDVSVSSDGTVYVTSTKRVRRIDPSGTISTVAGNGATSTRTGVAPADGLLATEVSFFGLGGIDQGTDGTLYVTDNVWRQVFAIAPDGTVRVVAGNGTRGNDGDGGLAIDATLNRPEGVHMANNGVLYITDSLEYVTRAVTPDGVIQRIAGTGQPPADLPAVGGPVYCSDYDEDREGGPASLMRMGVNDIETHPSGHLVLSDGRNCMIHELRPPRLSSVDDEYRVPDPDGDTVAFFGPDGSHLRTEDARSGNVLWAFDYEAGRLVRATSPIGTVAFERDGSGSFVGITDVTGALTTVRLDTDGWLDRVTWPSAETWSFLSTADGLLETVTPPHGDTATLGWSTSGLLTSESLSSGRGWLLSSARSGASTLVTMTSALGRRVDYTSTGREDSATERVIEWPSGARTTTVTTGGTAGDAGQSESVTAGGTTLVSRRSGVDPRWGHLAPTTREQLVSLPSGTSWHGRYDRRVTLGEDLTTVLAIDESFSETEGADFDQCAENGNCWIRSWDPATSTLLLTSPEGRTFEWTWGEDARVASFRPGTFAPVSTVWGADGRVTSVQVGEGADARRVTLTWSNGIQLARVDDARGRTTTFSYDDASRLVSEVLPDGGTVLYGWTDTLMSALTTPNEATHAYRSTADTLAWTPPTITPSPARSERIETWNVDDQLIEVERFDGSTLTWNWDATTGLPARVSDGTDSIEYTWSPTTGHLESASTSSGVTTSWVRDGDVPATTTWSGPVTGTVTRTWGPAWRWSSLAVNGDAMTIVRDADGLVTGMGDLTVVWDPTHGGLVERTVGNVTTTWTTNDFGEVSGIETTYAGAPLYSWVATRGADTWIQQIDETLDGEASVRTYTWDALGQLDTATIDGVTVQWGYDENRNRVRRDGAIAGTVDAWDRLTTWRDETWTWSDRGHVATIAGGERGSLAFVWDAFDMLTQATLDDGTVVDYLYDANRRRVARRIDGVFDAGWLYQDARRVVAEVDATGAVVSRFVWAAHGHTPDYMIRDGRRYAYVIDAVGSVRALVDVDTGEIAQALEYSAWGEVLSDSNPGFQPYGFAGSLYEPATGFAQMGERLYDGRTGRFVSPDPLGFGGGQVNVYAYADNNPVHYVDTTGRWTVQIGPSVSGGLGLGGVIGEGVVFGRDSRTGEWQLGRYATGGAGLTNGAEASLGIDFTFSWNDCIKDLGGFSAVGGGSGGAGVSVGLEAAKPLDSDASASWTIGLGAGGGAEIHAYTTYTMVDRVY